MSNKERHESRGDIDVNLHSPRGVGRVVWFVARSFPPINAIGADRAVKWIRSLRSHGCEVRVFTVDVHGFPAAALDSARSHAGLDCVEVTRTPMLFAREFSGQPARGIFGQLRRIVQRVITLLFRDSGWTWMYSLRQSLELAAKGKIPDCIISTGSPFLSFHTVRSVARKLGVPYVLDYRDPWSARNNAPGVPAMSRSLTRYLERKVNADAAAVVTVSHSCVRALRAPGPVHVLYNFPDAAYRREVLAVSSPTKPEWPLRLVFAGTLYQECGLGVIARAINALPVEYRNRISVDYCGASSSQARSDFHSEGLGTVLQDHGRLPKQEALTLVRGGDVAVSLISGDTVSSNAHVKGIISTKIFDYMLMNKCILNIGPRDNELTIWLDRRMPDKVTSFVADDIAGIAMFLKGRVDRHSASGRSPEEELQHKDPLLDEHWGWEKQFSEFYDEVLQPVLRRNRQPIVRRLEQ